MSNMFFTSDLHFGHNNIIRYTNRPFSSIEEMNNTIIANWNKVVKPNDTVVIVGDVFFYSKVEDCKEIMSKLNGIKILVRGNHDRFSYTRYYEIGFSFVAERLTLKIANQLVTVCHYPFQKSLWHRFKNWLSGFNRPYFTKYPKNEGQWLIHGHTHSKVQLNNKAINVCLEANKYTPVKIQYIQDLIGQYKSKNNTDEIMYYMPI